MGGLKYTAFAIIAVILVMGFSFKTASTIPDNAIVLVYIDKRVYYSPTYLKDNRISSDHFFLFELADAVAKGYKPDRKCEDAGYFSAEDQSPFLVYKFKELLGLNKKRWNEDGTWNW